MSNGFCVNYLLLISLAGVLFLVIIIQTYIGLLCEYSIEELSVKDKNDHAISVFISAAIYLFCLVVMIGIKFRKRSIVAPQGYQVLDDDHK